MTKTSADNTQQNGSRAMANNLAKQPEQIDSQFFANAGPQAIAQRRLQEMANNSPQVQRIAQLQAAADHAPPRNIRGMELKENILEAGNSAPVQLATFKFVSKSWTRLVGYVDYSHNEKAPERKDCKEGTVYDSKTGEYTEPVVNSAKKTLPSNPVGSVSSKAATVAAIHNKQKEEERSQAIPESAKSQTIISPAASNGEQKSARAEQKKPTSPEEIIKLIGQEGQGECTIVAPVATYCANIIGLSCDDEKGGTLEISLLGSKINNYVITQKDAEAVNELRYRPKSDRRWESRGLKLFDYHMAAAYWKQMIPVEGAQWSKAHKGSTKVTGQGAVTAASELAGVAGPGLHAKKGEPIPTGGAMRFNANYPQIALAFIAKNIDLIKGVSIRRTFDGGGAEKNHGDHTMPVVFLKSPGVPEPEPYWVDQRTSSFPDNKFSLEKRKLKNLKVVRIPDDREAEKSNDAKKEDDRKPGNLEQVKKEEKSKVVTWTPVDIIIIL